MRISRFLKEAAISAHNGTILAMPVLPVGMTAPFDHAWGYLEGPGELEGHSHPATEIYFVHRGQGTITVGKEQRAVSAGDVIEIPANTYHALRNDTQGELIWFALWWQPDA